MGISLLLFAHEIPTPGKIAGLLAHASGNGLDTVRDVIHDRARLSENISGLFELSHQMVVDFVLGRALAPAVLPGKPTLTVGTMSLPSPSTESI